MLFAKRLGWVGIVSALLLLPGCFDFAITVDLDEKGGGTLALDLAVPTAALAGHEPDILNNIILPLPNRQTSQEGELTKVREWVDFNYLDVLALRRMLVEVKETGTGILGFGEWQYQVYVSLETPEGFMPDRTVKPGRETEARQTSAAGRTPAELKASRLRAKTVGHNFVSLTLNLPGRVVMAQPVLLGDKRIAPNYSEDSGHISWRIPVSALLDYNLRHNLTFICEFRGHTAFRGREQHLATTRYATAADVATAQADRDKQDQQRKAQEAEEAWKARQRGSNNDN